MVAESAVGRAVLRRVSPTTDRRPRRDRPVESGCSTGLSAAPSPAASLPAPAAWPVRGSLALASPPAALAPPAGPGRGAPRDSARRREARRADPSAPCAPCRATSPLRGPPAAAPSRRPLARARRMRSRPPQRQMGGLKERVGPRTATARASVAARAPPVRWAGAPS
eukprot:5018416-Prymnesium_polylepis.2